MSADLLAAFGENPWTVDDTKPVGGGDIVPESHARPPEALVDDIFSQHKPQQILQTGKEIEEPLWQSNADGNDVLFDAEGEEGQGRANDDDEFGEFEDVMEQPHSLEKSAIARNESIHEKQQLSTVHSRVQEGTLIDLLSLDDGGTAVASATVAPLPANGHIVSNPSTAAVSTQLAKQAVNTDVFEDDGWGDFEAVQRQEPPVPHPAAPAPVAAHSQSTRPKGAPGSKPPVTPSKRNELPDLDAELDDDWAIFEDGQVDPQPLPEPIAAASTSKSALSQPKTSSNQAPAPPLSRPTNIPPPSILLSLLPTTFQSFLSSILHTPSLPSTQQPLPTQILSTHATAARITAGRTLRWKRDSILAQSTRISAAVGGGKSGRGMKLASVSKGEGIREEQAVEEMVQAWNGEGRRWQQGMAGTGPGIGVEGKGKGKIGAGGLKLNAVMNVKSMSGRLGVMEAGLVCALCGLKRSERVVGVDEGVEDVFGEFWVESWGHRDCVEWWERWKGELEQR